MLAPLVLEGAVRVEAGKQHPVAVRFFDYLREEQGHSTDFAFSRFLVTPDYLRTFTIRYHEANHDVSYSTARRDFQELVDGGFLDVRMDGKTQVFFAGPRFDERMAANFGIDLASPE